ncbi:MAG: flagellar basal body L-ring protein FlgH [Planctomycetes bacterium]|nr:flagellar basal body L-ring protein FlgH [Planctomycetota bacterium]
MKNILFTLVALVVISALALALDGRRRGSIYDPDAGPFGLVGTRTANKAGDLITIVIAENQDVSNQESSDMKKGTTLDYQFTNLDLKPNLFSTLPRVAGSSDDQFTGTANYAKKGKFNARVTAMVVDVLPNGNMIVNGRREIRIDLETKLIEFSGVIRRWDISPDNSVASELVANAKVSYTGTGPLTNSTNRRGIGAWVHDAIAWIWPF